MKRGKDITQLIETLRDSPMFQLSMSSKELFHSNFLYWISQVYPQAFVKILSDLLGESLSWKSWQAEREKEHIDLSVWDNGTPLFILENKVKDFPSKAQLDIYDTVLEEKGSNAHRLLLSMWEEENASSKYSPWKVCFYKQLAQSLKKRLIFNYKVTCKHRQIINDYINFILSFHGLIHEWKKEATFSPVYNNPANNQIHLDSFIELHQKRFEEANSLRLADYRGKICFAHLAQELSNHTTNHPQGKIQVNHFFSNGEGGLEIRVIPNNQYSLLTQIQHGQYRHCIEWNLSNKDITKIAKTSSNANKVWEQLFNTYWAQTQKLSFFNDWMEKANTQNKFAHLFIPPDKFTTGRKGKEFCRYKGKTTLFIYRYKKIILNPPTKDILEAMINDANEMLKYKF